MNSFPDAPLFLLYVATTKVGVILAAALEGTPFSVEDAVVLNQIDVLEPVTPSVLARRLGIAPNTLTYRLRSLERRQLVLRRANPADGRSVLLALSSVGRRRWERARPEWLGAVRDLEGALAVPRENVITALRAVATAADTVAAARSSRRTPTAR
jgi:DNA-binding MarR family transcriptional regulator